MDIARRRTLLGGCAHRRIVLEVDSLRAHGAPADLVPHFKADDPMNPIGEHWLGLEGIETANASLAGYGIHGTIEPESIGRDMSLGCVRLVAEDIAIVWETLGDGCEIEIR